jgi:hypothetical protein
MFGCLAERKIRQCVALDGLLGFWWVGVHRAAAIVASVASATVASTTVAAAALASAAITTTAIEASVATAIATAAAAAPDLHDESRLTSRCEQLYHILANR